MIEITHENIKRTVNTALSELKVAGSLETRISASHAPRHIPVRLALAAMLAALIAVTALAFAPSFQKVAPQGVWKYENGVITYQGQEDKYPKTILEDDAIQFISPDTMNTGTLYYITKTENGQYLNSITFGGYPISGPKRLSNDYSIRSLVADGSSCYLIADTKSGIGQVIKTDVYEGSSIQDEVISAPGFVNENIDCISVYENTLLAFSSEKSLLTAIHLNNRSVLSALHLTNVQSILVGDRFSDIYSAFALTDEGKTLMRIDLITGKAEKMDVSAPIGARALQRNLYSLYITDETGAPLAEHNIASLSGQKISKTLTIVNTLLDSPSMVETIRLFNEKYPDIQVVSRIIDDFRVAATELMAGEGGIDVLHLTGSWSVSPLPKLLKNGAIVDLTDNGHMIKAHENMRDIWGLVSESGRIYGAVSMCEICMWEVNPILKSKLNWTMPEGRWTISELKSLADKVIAYNQTNDRHIYLLADSGFIPNFMELYNAKYLNTYDGTVDYETQEFKDLLSLWKYLSDNRLLYPYPKGIQTGRIGSSDMVSNALLRVNYSSLGGYGEKLYILPPTYSPDDPLVSQTYALVANNNSDMREEAAYFVSLYASKAVTRYQFYLNNGQFIDKKEDYAFINMPDIRKASIENEAKWNYALENAETNHTPNALQRIVNTELLPAFLAGEIDEDAFARLIQTQAEMMLGE